MATVDKAFRIKNGLVVEGSTATVNGSNVLTEASTEFLQDTTAGIFDGSQNGITFSYNDETGKITATVDTTPTFASAIVFEGATADSYETTLQVIDPTSDITLTLPNATGTIALTSDIPTLDTDDVAEGSTNLYFTNQRALDATASAYDASGAAATAETNANSYTDGVVGTLDTGNTVRLQINQAESNANDYTNGRETAITTAYQSYADTAEADAISTAAADATSKANAAQAAAESYADGLAVNYDAAGSAAAAQTAAAGYTDDAVSALVNGAPELLDTLNELAAAIGDDENFATTVTNLVADKQNNLTTGANIDITSDVISVTGLDSEDISDFDTAALAATNAAYDAIGSAASAETAANGYTDGEITTALTTAQGYATTAQTNAEDYADGLAANYDSAGTASGLVDDLKDGTTAFSQVTLTDALIGTATQSLSSPSATVIDTWSATSYSSAKYLVQMKNGNDIEVLEVLVTVDGNNNVYITEYADVISNAQIGTTDADYLSGNVRLKVTSTNGTTVKVHKTLIEA